MLVVHVTHFLIGFQRILPLKVVISHVQVPHTRDSSWQPGKLMMQWKRNQQMAGNASPEISNIFNLWNVNEAKQCTYNVICRLMS